MTQKKNYRPHSRSSILLLTLLGFYSITMLSIVESSSENVGAGSESLSISSKSSLNSEESLSKEDGGPLLKFLLRPVEQPNSDNNAAIHKDNDGDNNDSNVSSETDSGEKLRLRREEVKGTPPQPGSSKVIATNWGSYEEQAPVVVQSESRTIDANEATDDDSSATFSDVFQSREQDDSSEYGGPVGEGSISYEDYEAGRFEGRQFYPSRGGGGYDNGEEQEHPDGYYRQKYYATTEKPLNQEKEPLRGEQPQEESENRPNRPNRPQRPHYRQPQRKEEEESTGGGLMTFVQKAKTFYDIFKAMNSAWKTVEDHYRKNGQGLFLDDVKNMNESTKIALNGPTTQESVNKNNNKNKKQPNTKRPKTTKAPITPSEEEEQQDDTTQEKDENRSRRSSVHEIVNDQETPSHLTTLSEAENAPSTEDTQITESDLESSESDSSSSTDVAEGRYIKGDPLKGYYDFVITEGSYKFWAVFQVGTAILIIYSTFAAIYYSKVNPLVSDYDYIDYLGGGRSLSDDSDFVDTDAPAGGDASKTAAAPGGATRSRQQSSAGWFGWLPHAGHTLRFILESIDKGYNEE